MLRPPSKIGIVTLGPICQKRLPGLITSMIVALSNPAAPVMLIRGKNAATATPMRALAAASSRSASATSGRRSSRCRGQPGGNPRRGRVQFVTAQMEDARGLADERGQGVFHLGAGALRGGQIGLVAGEFGAFALHVEFAGESGLEPLLRDGQRLAPGFDRALDDGDFRVGRAQVEIHHRDVGGHAQVDVHRVGLRRLPLRAGGLVVAAHAAEEVQLPVQFHRLAEQAESTCERLLV